jgi:NitT/TauT family transport system substrate-binding protein
MVQGRVLAGMVLAVLLACGAGPARAEQIAVGNYGVAANGMPYAVAMAKGYFAQEGANVTGIISSAGGGTSLRNMLSGGVPFGEVNPGVVVSAIESGADIRIISDDVLTVAEFFWAVKPEQPIHGIADLKGRKLGYTNPKSTSTALDALVVEKAGLKESDAQYVRTGGFGEGIAALDVGMIDVAPIPEPLWSKYKDKYRAIAVAAQLLPPLDNVVGVTTGPQAKARPDFIRAVIRARRRAVVFMNQHPNEAGDIVAKAYNLDSGVARSAIRYLTTAKTDGLPYWGEGDIHMAGLQRMIELQKSIGAVAELIDLRKVIDTEFLPDDLKAIK